MSAQKETIYEKIEKIEVKLIQLALEKREVIEYGGWHDNPAWDINIERERVLRSQL